MHETSAPVRPSLRCDTLMAVRLPAAEAILGVTISARAASMKSLRVMLASSCRFDAGVRTAVSLGPGLPDPPRHKTVSGRIRSVPIQSRSLNMRHEATAEELPYEAQPGVTALRVPERSSEPRDGITRSLRPTRASA